MVAAELPVSRDTSLFSSVEVDIAPHRDVDARQGFRMEQADEVNDEDVGFGDRFSLPERSFGPVESVEVPRLS